MAQTPSAANVPTHRTTNVSSNPSASDALHSGRRRRRGGGEGRGEGRGGRGRGRSKAGNDQAARTTTTMTPQNSESLPLREGANTTLSGSASMFVPASVIPPTGQTVSVSGHLQRPRQRHGQHRSPRSATAPAGRRQPTPSSSKRRISMSRSTAPDIANRVHEDIANAIYECAICTNAVSRHSNVWSCRSCWTVFHIGCIKKWTTNQASEAAQAHTRDGQPPTPRKWRCPGCNLPQNALPSSYHCWCEKEEEPVNIPGLPPHSCGQTCGRQRSSPKPCPHPCEMTCHAGPCPPCPKMGPPQTCFCAKKTNTRRCIDTNYDSGWTCGQNCGDVMPCGKHVCARPCHEGLCGACEVQEKAQCYCGKVSRVMKCDDLGEEKQSDGWNGRFDCHQPCKRLMDCGTHECEKTCHPLDRKPPHCPRSPDSVTRCPCGKNPLSTARTSCTDPIPSCRQPCGRQLACGHACEQACHLGGCSPCLQAISTRCRCGRTESKSVCHQQTEQPPQCGRVCRTRLNCGRHECGERCCTGERKAVDRLVGRKKIKTIALDLARQMVDEIEPEHVCTRICGRRLKCGSHTCNNLCHKGPCDSCKEASFDDLSCNCGRTVLRAPLPCGTQPPPCPFPCHRGKACDHPQTSHNCHLEAEACPRCPFLTEKLCMCGKKALKNQPCWRSEVSCGLPCGKRLRCGSHFCQKACHRAAGCEDAELPCQQPCGKAKKRCEHPCEKPCHAPSACKEDKACPFRILVTCRCQRKKEEARCNARAGMLEQPGDQPSLKCDEECARLERNRNVAAALQISDDHSDDHVPYSAATLTMYLEDVKWARGQEELLRVFAADPDEKRLRLLPMKSRQRAFIHNMAEDFGFDGESMDPEPHRHVMLFKTPKFVAAPMKTLQQAARIKRAALNTGAPVHSVADVTHSSTSSKLTSRSDVSGYQWNAVILIQPRFGLTMSELEPYILKAAPAVHFDIYFLTGADQVLLIPSKLSNPVTQLLEDLEPRIASQVSKHELAKGTTLGVFELSAVAEPRMISKKSNLAQSVSLSSATGGGDGAGWSQVAAKGSPAPKAPQVQAVGQKPVYTVLGSRLAEAKKKKQKLESAKQERKQDEVVDDWETAVEEEKDGKPSAAAAVTAAATAVGEEEKEDMKDEVLSQDQ